MDAQEVLDLIDIVSGVIGSDDETQISTAMDSLIKVKEFVSTCGDTINLLQDDVSRLNEKNIQLRDSNNRIMREVNANSEKLKKAQEELSKVDSLAQLF